MKDKAIAFIDKKIREISMFNNDDIFSIETKSKAEGAIIAFQEIKRFIQTLQDDSK